MLAGAIVLFAATMEFSTDDEEDAEIQPLRSRSSHGAHPATMADRVAAASGAATDRIPDVDGVTERDDQRVPVIGQQAWDHGRTAEDDKEVQRADDEIASDGEQSSAESSEEDVVLPRPRMRRLCWRLPIVGRRWRWVLPGPVIDHSNVSPLLFSMAVLLEGLPTFSCREAYARSVPILIKKGMYASIAAAYESIIHVFEEHQSSTSTSVEPSWQADSPDGVPIRRVLDRAIGAVRRSGGRVDGGSVKFVSVVPPSSHPWYA